MDAAVSHLLRTCLSRSPKDQAISLSTSQLSMPKDTSRLKKHITLLCDRIGKGGRLSLSSEANAPTPVMMPGQNCGVKKIFRLESLLHTHKEFNKVRYSSHLAFDVLDSKNVPS